MMRRWLRRILQTLLAFAVVGGVVYWMKFAPFPVKTHRLEPGLIVAEVMGTGTLEARTKTTVSPKIAGRIAQVLVDQNQRVETGNLLIHLDDDELKQQVTIAEANVTAEQAAIERLKADQERAAAVASQAKKQHARVQSLVEQRAVSQEDLDRAIESLSIAVAGLAHAEAAIAEAQRQLVAAEQTLEYHRARLADTKVVAPFAGLIVRRHRDPGDVVVPGSAVLTLIDTTEVWISAWVDETEMAKLQPEQSARVVFRSEPERSYPGTVVRLGREADRETREFVVDVQVLQLPKNWAVGQRAEVFIETSRKDGVPMLPSSFVVWKGGTSGVFLAKEGRAAWQPMKTGLRNLEWVEIMEGLTTGQVAIVPAASHGILIEGRRVALP